MAGINSAAEANAEVNPVTPTVGLTAEDLLKTPAPVITPAQLRYLRREVLGLTQKQLGQLVDLTETTIGYYEQGNRPIPHMFTLAFIALLQQHTGGSALLLERLREGSIAVKPAIAVDTAISVAASSTTAEDAQNQLFTFALNTYRIWYMTHALPKSARTDVGLAASIGIDPSTLRRWRNGNLPSAIGKIFYYLCKMSVFIENTVMRTEGATLEAQTRLQLALTGIAAATQQEEGEGDCDLMATGLIRAEAAEPDDDETLEQMLDDPALMERADELLRSIECELKEAEEELEDAATKLEQREEKKIKKPAKQQAKRKTDKFFS